VIDANFESAGIAARALEMSPEETQPGRSIGVIESKIAPPRLQPGMLRRSRLLKLVDGDGGAAVTVINAPVGYGKTTLLRLWCIERPEPVIWMTLDGSDDDPVQLWTHLATGVERLGQGLGGRALMCLGVRGESVETAVDELMNGLVRYGRPVSIVLDDLHAVASGRSLHSIAHAIERLPANARLVAATRSDPAFGLARLRARGALVEIRAGELAFTVDEARELLVGEGIELSEESVELLVERTEGWPAGLYLAALWLRDLGDPDEGVRSFLDGARNVADYLTDEVLTALAPQTRDFLVRTSVLGRFTPELCDAVLGREDSAAVLAALARSNMFLVALDGEGQWYRYHHLFGELLQLELGREDADALRRRAAAWCRAHGLIEDTIEYAAAAGDAETVAELLVEHDREFVWGGRIGQLLGWVRWLPPELLLEHPSLPAAGAFAAAMLARPEVDVQRLLAVAERSRRERPQLWSPYLEGVAEVTRAMGIEGGDVGAAVEHAHRAVAAARAGADALIVGVLAILSQALFFAGDLDQSRRIAMQAVERPEAPDRPEGYVVSLGLLALLDAEQGRTEGAEAWARQALSFAHQRSQANSWRVSLAHLGLALACAATERLDEAEREALRGERLRRSPQPTVGHTHALLVLAHVRVARSRLERAARDLKRAQRAIAEFRDPGRLPAIAATVEHDLATARANPKNLDIVEEPSAAELAVLRGLATGLSRREIGAELYISLNTVKTHTRELYRKLDATSRADAVARAEALGLLDLPESPG
jgi:LuxR family transcriptional regulator, maltose regulon positive regulatory protein